ncbi:EAL domain-containing protein [Paracoccus sp. CPCC 101403]|uniref:EAL domain-containing protein n=1 Tax=Paracoccus broussonetiae TaxID=3075834 RepID=A0ABU3EFJ0_9RHOB|nr:EAL domain-containing protein [Paracoccus sp. CPCC 101403]MDT1063013.1 EAL domain-containing protein [Paracoccus sp. CPCC 101403]
MGYAARALAQLGALFRPGRRKGTSDPANPPRFGSDQIDLQFQPQLCCDTGRVSGLRLLPQFRQPDGRVHGLAEVAPILTDEALSDCIMAGLRLALVALRRWDRLGVGPDVLTLALPDRALADAFLVQELVWELDRKCVEPARIEVEFAETGDDQAARGHVLEGVRILARAGCRIAIGEFGTGSASPSVLRSLPIHRVRIGRLFVAGCDRDGAQQRMILALLALAEHLGLDSLADGVVSVEERSFLTQIGFGAVQGMGVLPVMAAPAIDDILLGQRERAPLPAHLLRIG